MSLRIISIQAAVEDEIMCAIKHKEGLDESEEEEEVTSQFQTQLFSSLTLYLSTSLNASSIIVKLGQK